MRHTPGPWAFDASGDNWQILTKGRNDALMCDESYYPWVPDNEADWHLIAAAPELLDALKCLYDQGIDTIFEPMVKAAIAKAEGRP